MRQVFIFTVIFFAISNSTFSQEIFRTLSFETYTMSPHEELSLQDSFGHYRTVPGSGAQIQWNTTVSDTADNWGIKAAFGIPIPSKKLIGISFGFNDMKKVYQTVVSIRSVLCSKFVLDGTIAIETGTNGKKTHGFALSISRSCLLRKYHLIKWHLGFAIGKSLTASDRTPDIEAGLVYQSKKIIWTWFSPSIEFVAKSPSASIFEGARIGVTPAITFKFLKRFMLRLAATLPLKVEGHKKRKYDLSSVLKINF